MKFRTDFVTNSSDSSFLTFNIKNKQLYECLTGLGIKFENVKEGEFTDRMRIVLPSGKREIIDGANNWSIPYYCEYASISAWLVAAILWEVEEDPFKEEEDYSDFSKELIQLLNDADITHLDWNAVDTWSRWNVAGDLEKAFGKMDGDIEDAFVEHTYGFEGEVNHALYTEIHNGKRLTARYEDYSIYDGSETEDGDGLVFAVTGNLKHFEDRDHLKETIETIGGTLTDSVSKNTDYLVCNDINSKSIELEKAKELGISVLSEAAFIRRFCDIEEFDAIKDEDELSEDTWALTYDGGVLGFVMENGTSPILMEVWKDGKWVQGVSDQKQKRVLLSGKVFVVTGDVVHFKNRGEFKDLIVSMGGKLSESVSSKTSYLITNDQSTCTSKLKKAHELGVPIISEEEFLAMIHYDF